MKFGSIRRDQAARGGILLTIVIILSGCAVGPDFHPPEPVQGTALLPVAKEVSEARSASLPSGLVDGEQQGDASMGVGSWWRLFRCARLDALVEEAVTKYPSVAQQKSAIEMAVQGTVIAAGPLFPSLGVQASAERATLNQYGILYQSGLANLYTGGANISYVFDVFGGNRRALEGAQADEEEQRDQLAVTYLTLTGDVAATALTVASLRGQIATTWEILAIEEELLSKIRRRAELGSLTQSDVLQQETEIAGTRAGLPPLEQQLAVAQHQLAVLTDRLPSEMGPVELNIADFSLPVALPSRLPSEIVAQRPDIRAATARLHKASAQIGVATANMLPTLTLTSNYSFASSKIDTLFNQASAGWGIIGGVTQPLFDGGVRWAERKAAIAGFQAAKAQYRLAVLNAFQNVADSLTQLDNDAKALKTERARSALAHDSLALISRRYAAGAVDYSALLNAQRTYQLSRLSLMRATASRLLDTVNLFRALGGGWDEAAATKPESD